MKSRKFFTVTNLDIIEELKGKEIDGFVYPLSFFCVGVPVTFDIEDIKTDNSYIFVNRVLDSSSIDKLEKVLKDLPSNIKGIIFDDLGVIELLKDSKLEKILYNSHFSTNYESINYMFDYVDEIIVSTDITESEIDEIIKKTKKRVSALVFGLIPTLYSRRSLLTNHAKHYDIETEDIKELNSGDKKFIAIENEFGTMMYHYPYFDGRRLQKKDLSISFYFPILLNDDEIMDVLNNNYENINTDEAFLDTKTIYKVRGN